MPRTKKQDVRITIAIISALGAIVAAYVGSPLINTQHQERPIVDVSFGGMGLPNYPNTELQNDGNNYHVDLLMKNRGHVDGKIIITIKGTHTKIWSNFNNSSDYSQSVPVTVLPNSTVRASKIIIMPDPGQKRFDLELSAVAQENPEPYQELNVFTPTKLTYEFQGSSYKLIYHN